MPYNLSMMTRGGEIYKIQAKYKFDLQPKWEDEKFQTGGRYFLSFKQAQDFKKKLQGQSSYYMEYKVVKVEEKMADGGDVDDEGIVCKGRSCDKTTKTDDTVCERSDAYGIFTGYYCDDCYENNYPYRRDRYFDESYAGERMDDDYAEGGKIVSEYYFDKGGNKLLKDLYIVEIRVHDDDGDYTEEDFEFDNRKDAFDFARKNGNVHEIYYYPKGTSSNPKSIYAKGGEVKKGSEWAFWAGLLGWGVLSYIGVNKK